MAYPQGSKTLREHRALILDVALRHASAKGLAAITRAEIAEEAGIATGIVNAAYGTMQQLRRAVMRAAIEREVLAVVAGGLAAMDPQALKAPQELRARALEHLTQ